MHYVELSAKKPLAMNYPTILVPPQTVLHTEGLLRSFLEQSTSPAQSEVSPETIQTQPLPKTT